MFCRNCGSEMDAGADVCMQCGIDAGLGNSYCANCGTPVEPSAATCIACGNKLKKGASGKGVSPNNRTTLAIIAIFLGAFGVHHLLMGEKKKAVMKILLLFICGISGILGVIDGIRLLIGTYRVGG